MYKVYGSVASRAFRVLWMLEELGETYEYHDTKPQSEAARALNPSGKVPILVDGDAVLTDSTAILTYLADKHGKLTYPAGSVERARQDALTHTLLDEFDAVLWTAARHSFVLPKERRVPEVSGSLKWEFARNLDRLAERFVGPFLQGEQMTIADIICVHCLNWAFGAKFPVENERLLAYTKAMRGREAFKRVRALSEG
ncbi:glutathione S-transferase family protein [Antarcticimicrobium luteum]|uniref:Glutathione S-transferase family protein n=1 Tax=Antarcticimicrobium luteum TaxID=2547397 RepID=A0A4R5V3W9_9RHOB|nr:glutathione S-transferase family protein [Antarcticimicrobium luteum]TDK46215.1 glutathione S-transferase family protein [Antarcticimicrobium luteum]